MRTPVDAMRRNLVTRFSWNLIGNTLYRFMQWMLIVVLARLGGASTVGEFALAQAVSAPIFLAVGLNLRAVRATDVSHRWSNAQYLHLRTILNFVSLALTGAIIALFSSALLPVALMVALGKSSEATSQLLYGYFQLRGRLDLVSRSLLLRSFLGFCGFTFAYILSNSLLLACLGLAVGWTLVYFIHDRPQMALLSSALNVPGNHDSIRHLARKAFPLGLDGGANSLTTNMPRFALQATHGASTLGAFAALAYLGQIITMITGSLADVLISPLARSAQSRDAAAFKSQLLRLIRFAMGVSALAIAWGALLGDVTLRAVLGPQYADQGLLMAVLSTSTLATLQRCMGRGLQAAHQYSKVLAADLVALVGSGIGSLLLVPGHGALGAAYGLGIGFLLSSVVSVYWIRDTVHRMSS